MDLQSKTPYLINISQFRTGSGSLQRALDICYWGGSGGIWFEDTHHHRIIKARYYKNNIKWLLRGASRYNTIKDHPWNARDIPYRLFDAYPNAKFVVVERDPEEWYESLLRWTYSVPKKLIVPSLDTNKIASVVAKNLNLMNDTFGVEIDKRELVIEQYLKRNEELKTFFSGKPNFYLLKFTDHLNWQTVQTITGIETEVIRQRIIDYYQYTNEKYATDYLGPIQTPNDPIDKWIFPTANRLASRHIIDEMTVWQRTY